MKQLQETQEESTSVSRAYGSIDEAILQLSDMGYSVIIPDGLREGDIRKGKISLRGIQTDPNNISSNAPLEACVKAVIEYFQGTYAVTRVDTFCNEGHEVQLNCRAQRGNSALYSHEDVRKNGFKMLKAGSWEY
ncbi:MAG: hypothetical protein ACMXYE_03540 [Candidatus Woesearchaeota archaeon]